MPAADSIDDTSISFEGFTVDVGRRGLYRGSERVHLTPIPFKVLEFLVRNRGSVVSKEQLLNAVWGGQRDENTVEQAIRQIRRALGDEKEQPRFIQTIPGVGYCFIAECPERGGAESKLGAIPPAEAIQGVPRAGGATQRSFPKWPLTLTVGAILFLSFSVALLQSPLRLAVENPVKITQSETVVLSPLLSGGSRIYYPQYDDGQYSIASTSAKGGARVTVATGLPNPELCDLTPDGSAMLLRNLIHSRNDDEPLYVQFKGRPAQRLGNILAYDAAWYPNAKRILYSADGVVYSTVISGKPGKRLFSVPGNAFWFRWSPDGSNLRFTVINKKSEATSIWEVKTGSNKPHQLFSNLPYQICCGTWTPDGKFFLFQARVEDSFQIWAHREQHNLLFSSHNRPFPLIFGAMSYRGPLVSKDGKELFLRAEDPKGELVRYDSGAQAFVPMLPAMSVRTLAFSRDGNWVAYSSLTDDNLWRCRADGTKCLQLTQDFKNTLMPRWSPDGRSIVFMGLRFTGEWGVFVVSADGGPVHTAIQENQAEGYPDWSPDGHHLIFSEVIPVAHPEGIHLLDLRTNRITTLPGSTNFFLPRWSPDGRFIVALHSGDHHLYLFDLETGAWRPLAGLSGGYPNWSHHGKYVYFLSNTVDGRTVFRVSVEDRAIAKVANLASVEPCPFILGDWMGLSPDDSPLAVQDMSTDDIYKWDLITR